MSAATICPSNPLDPGIAHVVAVLREQGVHTYESCEGGTDHSYRDPTVRFYGSQAEGWRVLAVCKERGLRVRHLARCWDMDDGEPSGPYWQIEFFRPS